MKGELLDSKRMFASFTLWRWPVATEIVAIEVNVDRAM